MLTLSRGGGNTGFRGAIAIGLVFCQVSFAVAQDAAALDASFRWSATGFDYGPGCKAPKSGAETAGSGEMDPRLRRRTAPETEGEPRPMLK